LRNLANNVVSKRRKEKEEKVADTQRKNGEGRAWKEGGFKIGKYK